MIFGVDRFKIQRTFIVFSSALPLPVSKCQRIITLQFIGAWMSLASFMYFFSKLYRFIKPFKNARCFIRRDNSVGIILLFQGF